MSPDDPLDTNSGYPSTWLLFRCGAVAIPSFPRFLGSQQRHQLIRLSGTADRRGLGSESMCETFDMCAARRATMSLPSGETMTENRTQDLCALTYCAFQTHRSSYKNS